MRRENRKRGQAQGLDTKKMLYITGAILALAVIAFIITFVIYGNTLKDTTQEIGRQDTDLSSTYSNDIAEETSNPYGKTVNEMQEGNNIAQTQKNETSQTTQNQTSGSTSSNKTTNKIAVNTSNIEKKTNKENKNEVAGKKEETTTKTEEIKKTETVPDPKFKMPVQGEIMQEFANNKLVYSNTLDVWASHNGIDIKADKTTVVKAAAEGTVQSIKNDPRYGLTITIEHVNGYKTVYANLLSTEFVVAGEKVKQGQSIGTVGNTATFELSDESHLHFELLKDNEQQDPELYLEQE